MKHLFLTLIFIPFSLFSQDEMGNWLMYFGTNKVSQNWSIHSEIQYRNHTIAPTNVEQLLLRTGVNYHLKSNNAIVTAGYGYVANHVYESPQKNAEVNEHRIFEQFILNNYVGRVKFEHRYRIEQRWVDSDYKNRFRYRLMLFIPLNKPKIEKGTIFLGLYDEVFLNTKATFFDRNRLYAAVGYQFSKSTSLQIGVLQQQLSTNGKFHLQFGLTFNPNLMNKK
ncbi:MAG: DUF2490 domain-containing protein [Crocinitomix sp.]|nr:DUF2490 domain-containing protein [Crocinitomix sp.]